MKKAKFYFFSFIVLFFLFSCEEDDGGSEKILEGTYSGVFVKSAPHARYSPVEISFTFVNETYKVIWKLDTPVICSGTFKLAGGKFIEFDNECNTSQEPDSAVMIDRFNFFSQDDKIIMVKSHGESVYSTFTLKKINPLNIQH